MARTIRDPESRNRIVETAWRLVAARGLAGTTMRSVATEAGVSTGSVTHYFEDKAELMDTVLLHNGARATQRVMECIGKRTGLDAVEHATLGLLPVDDERHTCWRVWLAFWAQFPDDSSTGSGFSEGYRDWAKLVRHHLAQAVERGELPEGLDLRHEVSVLGTMVAGTGLLSGADVDSRSQLIRRAKRVIREHFASLKQPAPPA